MRCAVSQWWPKQVSLKGPPAAGTIRGQQQLLAPAGPGAGVDWLVSRASYRSKLRPEVYCALFPGRSRYEQPCPLLRCHSGRPRYLARDGAAVGAPYPESRE